MTPWRLVICFCLFGVDCCLHVHSNASRTALNREAQIKPETSAKYYQSTRCHISQCSNVQQFCRILKPEQRRFSPVPPFLNDRTSNFNRHTAVPALHKTALYCCKGNGSNVRQFSLIYCRSVSCLTLELYSFHNIH